MMHGNSNIEKIKYPLTE